MADLVANGRSETAVLDVAALARLVRHAAAAAARALRPLRPVRPARRILKKKKTKEIIFSVSHRFLGRFFFAMATSFQPDRMFFSFSLNNPINPINNHNHQRSRDGQVHAPVAVNQTVMRKPSINQSANANSSKRRSTPISFCLVFFFQR